MQKTCEVNKCSVSRGRAGVGSNGRYRLSILGLLAVHCTVYNVHYTLHNEQFILQSAHSGPAFQSVILRRCLAHGVLHFGSVLCIGVSVA